MQPSWSKKCNSDREYCPNTNIGSAAQLGWRCRHDVAHDRAIAAIRFWPATLGPRLGQRPIGRIERAGYAGSEGYLRCGPRHASNQNESWLAIHQLTFERTFDAASWHSNGRLSGQIAQSGAPHYSGEVTRPARSRTLLAVRRSCGPLLGTASKHMARRSARTNASTRDERSSRGGGKRARISSDQWPVHCLLSAGLRQDSWAVETVAIVSRVLSSAGGNGQSSRYLPRSRRGK